MVSDDSGRRSFLRHLAASSVVLSGTAAAEHGFAPGFSGAPAEPAKQNSGHIINVLDFGAVGDGRKLCTANIQAAINDCAEAGGGKVIVPPGRYVTGPIFLKSNLEFEIFAGATLLGSTNFADYPTIQGWWEGLERTVYASLITGIDLENVSITGKGTLDGQGAIWLEKWHQTQELRERLGIAGREPENPPGSPLPWPRPRMINLYRCHKVLISRLTIQSSPSWTVHPVMCEDVHIDGLTILNPRDSWNTDGIDPESCRNVRISGCYISTGDDCIMIKSGYKYIPGKPFPPSENIVVTNCVFNDGGCGVGIGSETAGGVRNVAISNCACEGTTCGLYFRTARGRGNVVENISAVNVVMRNIRETGIVVSMLYEDQYRNSAKPVDERTPTIRNLHCSDVLVDGAQNAVIVEGLPESPIQSLTLDKIFVSKANKGISSSHARGLGLTNTAVNTEIGPAVSCKNVSDLELERVRTSSPTSAGAGIDFENVQQAVVQSCSAVADTSALLRLTGKGNENITLVLNRISGQTKEVVFKDGATDSSVVRHI